MNKLGLVNALKPFRDQTQVVMYDGVMDIFRKIILRTENHRGKLLIIIDREATARGPGDCRPSTHPDGPCGKCPACLRDPVIHPGEKICCECGSAQHTCQDCYDDNT